MAKTLKRRAGDTEQLEVTISGKRVVSGLLVVIEDLDELTSARLYVRKRGEEENEVDGVLMVESTGLGLIFDPVENGPSGATAFLTEGIYDAYILCTWSDGDTTRHPQDDNAAGVPDLHIVVSGNFE